MWFNHTGAFTSGSELGNLNHPLAWWQIFGIWPTGDFRTSAHRSDITGVLIALVVIGAVLAVVLAWRRRGFGLLTLRGERAGRQHDLLGRGLSVDRRQGDRDRVSARSQPRARRRRLGLRARPAGRGRPRGGGDRLRRRLVGCVGLPRRVPCPQLAAVGARGDRQQVRRPGAGARDGLRPLRRQALPAQARRRGDIRASRPPDPAADRRRAADRRVGRPRRDRAPRRARLPDDRPARLTRGEPAALGLSADRGDAPLPGLAAARLRRADDPRAPVARRPAARRGRPEVHGRAPPREGGGAGRSARRRRAAAEHGGRPERRGPRRERAGSERRPGSSIRSARRRTRSRSERPPTGFTRSGSTAPGGACSSSPSTATRSRRSARSRTGRPGTSRS